jgi:hypothetical protein
MAFFHSHPTATVADEFHRCQFVFADMLGINLWRTTKTTVGCVTTRIA